MRKCYNIYIEINKNKSDELVQSLKNISLAVCPSLFYGLKTCQKSCNCILPCHILTGACPGKCLHGFEGERCDIRTCRFLQLLA